MYVVESYIAVISEEGGGGDKSDLVSVSFKNDPSGGTWRGQSQRFLAREQRDVVHLRHGCHHSPSLPLVSAISKYSNGLDAHQPYPQYD